MDKDKEFTTAFKKLDPDLQNQFWKDIGRSDISKEEIAECMQGALLKYHQTEHFRQCGTSG